MQSRLKVKSDCQRGMMKGGGEGGVWRGGGGESPQCVGGGDLEGV